MNTKPKQTFGAVQIGNQVLENLYKSTIDKSMSGNAGLAIMEIRRKGFEPTNELYALNDQLVNIELTARREMRKRIQDYLDSLN